MLEEQPTKQFGLCKIPKKVALLSTREGALDPWLAQRPRLRTSTYQAMLVGVAAGAQGA